MLGSVLTRQFKVVFWKLQRLLEKDRMWHDTNWTVINESLLHLYLFVCAHSCHWQYGFYIMKQFKEWFFFSFTKCVPLDKGCYYFSIPPPFFFLPNNHRYMYSVNKTSRVICHRKKNRLNVWRRAHVFLINKERCWPWSNL